jgi:hypothetical protein
VQIAQQRESGCSGSQLLQQGRANAAQLAPIPTASAKAAISILERNAVFMGRLLANEDAAARPAPASSWREPGGEPSGPMGPRLRARPSSG